jgi:hypothetical protein
LLLLAPLEPDPFLPDDSGRVRCSVFAFSR